MFAQEHRIDPCTRNQERRSYPDMIKIDWSDDLIHRICLMINEGMSTSAMALAIGDGMTRNCIIGKFRRLGLPLAKRPGFQPSCGRVEGRNHKKRAKPVAGAVQTVEPVEAVFVVSVPDPAPEAVPEPVPEPAPEPSRPVEIAAKKARRLPFTGYGSVEVPEGAAAALFFLPANGCHWPDGDPRSDDFRMCGDLQAGESSYCAAHAKLGAGSGTYGERKAVSGLNRRI